MKSMQDEGVRLIREAEGILKRDAQGALIEKNFNMVFPFEIAQSHMEPRE